MNELGIWTINKMKTKDACKRGKEENGSCLCRDNVSFKDEDCQKCFREEIGLGFESMRQ